MSEATLSVEATAAARLSEDWLAVLIGLGAFALALLSLIGLDALGWVATTSVWTDPSAALAPASKTYSGLSGAASLVLTYFAGLSLILTTAHARPLPGRQRVSASLTASSTLRRPVAQP